VIGPGWLPSRPRPLGRVRKGLLSYTFRRRRRRSSAPRSAAAVHIAADATAADCNTVGMLFDGYPAELPIATLLPSAAHARHRVIGGHLRHWLDDRWAWLRPRTVPMIVAFAGMLAVLGSTKYLSSFASAPMHAGALSEGGAPPPRGHACWDAKHRDASPGHIRIVPVRPGSHDVTITLEP
jgi:hypothetical protein